jgi:hypothetical protein
MRNARGYIAIDRGIFDHPMFRRRPEWLVAWQWLIATAAWKPKGQRFEYGVVHLERGQLATTVRGLGTTWGWPKSNVARFLARLTREEMIALNTGTRTGTRTGTQCTVITICNYDRFQNGSEKVGHEPGHEPGHESQQAPLFTELLASQPTNQLTKEKVRGENCGENGQVRVGRTKPPHGSESKDGRWVWYDHGTENWDLYAKDIEEVRGAACFPESRVGGRGNWFFKLGERLAPRRRRAS